MVDPDIERLRRRVLELEQRDEERSRDLVLANAILQRQVDELRRNEKVVCELARECDLIMNNVPNLVSLLTADGVPERMNRQILEFTGKTPVELIDWGASDLVHPEDREQALCLFEAGIGSGEPFEIVCRMRRFDGVYRWFHARHQPLKHADGRVERWYVAVNDIEDRKRAEQSLEDRARAEEALSALRSEFAHSSRISSLGILTASVAHELSQPLLGILTNANTCQRMLAATPPNVEGALETTRRTVRDGTRASEVIERLRALFYKRTDKAEQVDLNEAVAEVVALASSELSANGVVLQTELAKELPRLTVDRVQLQQVVLSLLSNAVDAMSRIDDRKRLAVIRTALDDDGVRVSVEDVGVGFSVEDAERLFQAFYTTKSCGTGIGLSLSRSIIERYDGRLWGEPNAGPGATFTFFLPVRT
jgi:PAS domain S-box-containing protein